MTSWSVSREGNSRESVALDLDFALELESFDVLVDASCGIFVDAVDDGGAHAHGLTRCRLRIPPLTAVKSMPRLMSLLPMTSMTCFATNSAGAATVSDLPALSR